MIDSKLNQGDGQRSIHSPVSKLLKKPFIKLKVIEAKDINVGHNRSAESCDLYAKIAYGNLSIDKTRVISKNHSPTWNHTMEFDYNVWASEAANVVTISVFDADSLGSDEQIANQIIPLQYFKERDKFGKTLDLWLKMSYLDDYGIKEQIVVETTGSLYCQVEVPDFPDQVATQDDIDNKSIPKIHVILEVYDPVSILKFNVAISDIEEHRSPLGTFFVYVIKVNRNDGRKWVIRRRYAQICDLRNTLKNYDDEVKQIPFPHKSSAKFMSQFCFCLHESYRKKSEQRMHRLENFLNQIASINYFYNLDEFIQFFSN